MILYVFNLHRVQGNIFSFIHNTCTLNMFCAIISKVVLILLYYVSLNSIGKLTADHF